MRRAPGDSGPGTAAAAPFRVGELDGGVVSLRVASDAEPYLGPGWVEGFESALAALGSREDVRAVVLEGGERNFCLGARREDLLAATRGAGPAAYVARVPRALLALPVPAVAAMSGHAVGGGLVLGLWCDAAMLAAGSLYGANFMALGFPPGMGATHVVSEAFGGPLGRELLYTGRLLTGREIGEAGCPLSHAVHPRGEVWERALKVAREMAEAPRQAAVALKASVAARRGEALERALRSEAAGQARVFTHPSMAGEITARYGTPWAHPEPETR